MIILHESTDELVLLSSARTFRMLGALLLAVGLFVGLSFVGAGVASLWRSSAERISGFPLMFFMIILGTIVCWFAPSRLAPLLRARDAEYRFLGSEHKLIILYRYREPRVIQFSEIAKAVVYFNSSIDGPDTYGLYLKLRGSLRDLQMSLVENSDDDWRRQMSELAERINRFLEA
jgi:hypothetical protein